MTPSPKQATRGQHGPFAVSTFRRVVRRGPGGRATALVATALAVVVPALAPTSVAAFTAVVFLGLVITAHAARRWPLVTLVAASITTLADPVLAPHLLPVHVDLSPIGISEPLLLVAGSVVLINAAQRRLVLPALRDPVLALTGLFVGIAVVSAAFNAVPPPVAFLGILVTVDAIALYFAARMTQISVPRAALSVGLTVAVAVVAAIVGIAQVVLHPNLLGLTPFIGQFGEGVRITSFIGNPNMVAGVIGIALPFALYGSRHLERSRLRWAARAALFTLMVALVLTFSRGGWLAVALGMTIGALVVDRRSLPVLFVSVALALLTTTLMPRSLLASQPSDPPRVVESTLERLTHLGESGDLRARFLRDGLRVAFDRPILGVGPGRYGGAVATIIPSPVYEAYDASLAGYRTVHNFWLHLLTEGGGLGLAAFATIVLTLMIRFARGAHATSGSRFVLTAGAATMLLVVSLQSVTEMTFEGNMPIVIVWVLAGIASAFAPGAPLHLVVSTDRTRAEDLNPPS